MATKAAAKSKTSALVQAGIKHVKGLLAVPSATNRITESADYVEKYAKKLGYVVHRQPDDTLRITVIGKDKSRVVGFGAHLDRIGLMVDELCDDGTVKISSIGGLYPGHVMDGVVASIASKKGYLPGVITHVEAPIHKLGVDGFEKRAQKWKHIRLRPDACIGCTKKNGKDKLKELGVQPGQLVWLDPMLRIDDAHGTLRSRWLDNTLGCAALLVLLEEIKAGKATPRYTLDILFSAAEEAGLGGTAVIRPEMTDFVAIDTSVGEEVDDMAHMVIKQKAGRFPYTQSLTEELEMAADKAKVGFERRVFEGGGTDAEQARSAGFKGRLGCMVVPIYGLHSIEAATFTAFEGLMKTLRMYAIGK